MEVMSPQEAVHFVARSVTENPGFSEDAIHASMVAAGVPDRDADLAYKFTQAAWGRLLLDGLGIQFAHDYHILDGAGDTIESGTLSEQPHFAAATKLGAIHANKPGFQRLAAMSADFHSVNAALNAGSQPENLITAPLFLFVQAPSEMGMKKAQQLLSDLLSRRGKTRAVTEPPRQTDAPHKQSWFQKIFRRS